MNKVGEKLNKARRTPGLLIAALVSVLLASPSWAGPREDQARKLEKAGEALFQAGKYQDAIKQFQEVVRGFTRPEEVIRTARWNIARCHEELGDDEAALKAFFEFAKMAKTPDEKQDVAAKLKQIRSRLAARVRLVVQPDNADVHIDGKVVGRKALSGTIELKAGQHTIVVRKPGFIRQEKTLNLKSREKKEVRITLEAVRGGIEKGTDQGKRRPVPPKPYPTEKKGPAVTGQVALSLGEGFLRAGGTTERTHVTLEALGGVRFRGVRWLQVELALAVSVESPVMVLLRPGLRLYTGDVPIFFRVAAQVMVTPSASGGILLGAGGEIPLGKGWSLPLGIDVNLWPSAISVVPVEFKAGVAYAF